jgi:Fic family protein
MVMAGLHERLAIAASADTLQAVLTKARFWGVHTGEAFNERQRRIINCLLDGFDDKLNSSKWAKLAQCSQDTALRDINDLLERKILIKDAAGGRSTSYQLRHT